MHLAILFRTLASYAIFCEINTFTLPTIGLMGLHLWMQDTPLLMFLFNQSDLFASPMLRNMKQWWALLTAINLALKLQGTPPLVELLARLMGQ